MSSNTFYRQAGSASPTNELPRSKLRGIKDSEYRIQESGEELVLPHFVF
jgi:hypothetical protein